MRVYLKLVLDAEPDATWRAIQSPAVFREASAPVMRLDSLEPGGFPTVWSEGSHLIEAKILGVLPVGTQRIVIDRSRSGDEADARGPGRAPVRILRDRGRGESGALALASTWDHRMAVAPAADGSGRTLYRDRLEVGAGVLTPALWYAMWAFWQIRGARLRALAPTWSYEPGPSEPSTSSH